jgi:hypothetical protein
MKWTALVAASVVAVGTFTVAAPKGVAPENSADVLRPQQLRKSVPRVVSPLLAPDVIAAVAPTVEDVGDADSFGRNVTYLGLAQTQSVVIQPDCSGSDPTLERCVVAAAAPAPTPFNEADLATINLPAKASKSLMCFTLTPFISLQWANNLATPATARFSGSAVVTIENAVLDDPALIDPGTGLPFGGSMTLGLSTYFDAHTMQPGESDSKNLFMTRACIAGLVSKRSLVDNFGLTDGQATEFFKKPMTIRFGSRGTVALAEFANYFYGIRLFGD